LFRARAAVFFACAVTIVLALQATVWVRIQRVNDQRDVKFTPADLKDKNPMASMLGVDEKVEGDDVVTTVSTATYDAMECRKWFNATVMPMCICVGIHTYWGMLPPLVLMPLNQLMDAMNHSLTRCARLLCFYSLFDHARPSPYSHFLTLHFSFLCLVDLPRGPFPTRGAFASAAFTFSATRRS
jgi:hypothetical protein